MEPNTTCRNVPHSNSLTCKGHTLQTFRPTRKARFKLQATWLQETARASLENVSSQLAAALEVIELQQAQIQSLNDSLAATVATLQADVLACSPPSLIGDLLHIADRAAHSGDLRSMCPADSASHASAPWDELRVWDSGD